ncbi:MAG TPA: LLM class flavin-dependent oxidoreductase [Acetobacteraceae bacterium]|jgi:alkanesulfonate monooxygenase SsuD/methylene tetrahydromethanopterin reductase-like flavin-dependent oxidoreductase (luciferase family)|nr:LLM class flavin-dependent oxidoreductase [Acetobacteraceae bacterium]
MITKFDSLYAGHVDLDNVGYGGTPINDRLFPNEHLATALSKAQAMAQLMDRMGYTTFWMAEHHFQREGTECIPNVLLMAMHLTHVTRNLKIGCGFNIAPMWHPLRLAEDYAMADILSGGRVVFGLGRGYHTREVETFGAPLLDQAANRELFEEQVDIVFKAFNQDRFSHQGKHYTLPPEVPYRGYTLKDLTLVPRPLRLPVETWQPIQGGTARAMEFMAKHGIQGMVGGGSAEGGAMHKVVMAWQEAHAALGKRIELGERLCFGFHFYMADSREAGIRKAAKYYEENMKMFGELRLVRALSEEQIEIMRDPQRAPMAKLPRIEDAINAGGFLCGSPQQMIDHLKALEEKYPALDRISVSLSVGVPESEALEQLQRFAEEVMPAFKGALVRQPELAK